MRHVYPQRFAACRGFTLIESIIALVLLGIASISIISLQTTIFNGQSDNKVLEVGTQLMQECAEQVLAMRRNLSYTSVTTSACNGLGNYGGFGAPILTLINDSGSSVTACTNASATCTATITINKGGPNLTPVVLQLVNY